MQASDIAQGFAPLWQPHAKVLVLGTLPSVKSLEKHEYYGHPQNAFWPIMANLCGFDASLAYQDRCARLSAAGVALWDVIAQAERPGSLDASIRSDTLQANPLNALIKALPACRLIAFNGQAAARHFKQLELQKSEAHIAALEQIVLPSTSPAYAAMRPEQKLQRWSVLKSYLQESSIDVE